MSKKQIEVHEFYKIFMEENIDEVIKKYSSYRDKILTDRDFFSSMKRTFASELTLDNPGKSDGLEFWKEHIYKCFEELIDICERYEGKERRQYFIDTAISHMKTAEQKMTSVSSKEKYAHLYLILDIIWTYFDKNDKFKLSAVIYDIIGEMNYRSGNIKKFYQTAEEEIVRHTYNCMSIICKASEEQPKEYMEAISYSKEMDFVEEFIHKLKEELGEQEKVLKKQKKEEKRKKEQMRRLIAGIGIVVMSAALFAGGFLLAKKMNSSEQELVKKEQEVEELKNKLQEYEQDKLLLEQQLVALKKEIAQSEGQPESSEIEGGQPEDIEIEGGQPEDIEIEGEGQPEDIEIEGEGQPEDIEIEGEGQPENTESEGGVDLDDLTYELTGFSSRNVRSSKDTTADNIVGEIQKGDRVTVREPEDESGWMKIYYQNEDGIGIEGYILLK